MIPEIISAIANALMAIAAILGLGFTAYSVYQASKNIESATRPVITPYIELVNSDPGAYYFIIKNFGASSARITGFKTELRGFDDINNDMPILQQLSIHRTYDPFENIVGTEFPPGYKLYTTLALFAVEGTAANAFKRGYDQSFIAVTIDYLSDAGHHYSERHLLNLASAANLSHDRHEDVFPKKHPMPPEVSIAHTLKRLEERLL